MSYDNTNKGALFINKYKSKDSQPDLNGELDIDGKVYKISGWKNESPKAGKYIGLRVQVKEDAATEGSPKKSNEPLNEEVPF